MAVAPHLTVESQKNRQGAESAKFFKIYEYLLKM